MLSVFGQAIKYMAISATALGQKQPLNSIPILASEWLLSGYTGHSPLKEILDHGCVRFSSI